MCAVYFPMACMVRIDVYAGDVDVKEWSADHLQ